MKPGSFAISAFAATALASTLFSPSSHAQTFPTFGDYSFPGGTGGSGPRGALVQTRDGSFYGATYAGGANNTGTIFKIAQGYVTLHEFGAFGATNNNADGGRPNAALTEGPDGNLYGTTAEGGTFGDGTIFRVTPDGQFATIFNFSNGGGTGRNALNPLLLASDGALYGTAYTGGFGFGTIFKVTTGGVFSVITTLSTGNGANPLGALVEGTDGFLYGTTSSSAANNNGTVFKVAKDGSGFAVLHVFSATGSNSVNNDGSRPFAGLALGPDGALYGTTSTGGSGGYGAVFRITNDGSFSVLHNFVYGDGNGRYPQAALVYARNGTFYGTTSTGGANSRGTVFRITPDGQQFATVANLDGSNSGDSIPANVIRGRDGQLYGLAQAGGANNRGAIFEVDLEPAFFNGRVELGGNIDYLAFPNGNVFGYYGFLPDQHYIYHQDMGYEYLFDANDGQGGVYLYDFTSGSFFYTSPSFGFPYLYDFSLQAFLYYYPDPDTTNRPGRYNTNGTRYFYNFTTGQIISK